MGHYEGMGDMPLFRKTKLKLKAVDIAKAFNKNKDVLFASEVDLCCNRGKKLTVSNQAVLLRRLLKELGFDDTVIDRVLHQV